MLFRTSLSESNLLGMSTSPCKYTGTWMSLYRRYPDIDVRISLIILPVYLYCNSIVAWRDAIRYLTLAGRERGQFIVVPDLILHYLSCVLRLKSCVYFTLQLLLQRYQVIK